MRNPSVVAPEGSTPLPRAEHGFGKALSWSYVMTGGRMVTTLAVSLILARLLGPAAFGLIAMANVFVFFIEMLVRQGLVAAIIQRPGLSREHMDTAFWMIMAVVAVTIPLAIGLSPLWSRLNQTPDLQPIIIGLSPVLLLKGLAAVQEAQLRRRLDYRSLAIRTNLAVFLGGVTGVAAALAGAGVWALVAQQLVLASVEVAVLWKVSDWRPGWAFDRPAARELLSFSGFSGLAGLGSFLNQRMDALMIGLLFGPVPAGLFRLAARLTETLMQASSGALQSVSLPELSRFTDDREAFNRRTADLLHLAAVMSMPLFALLAVLSEPLLAFLGPDWVAATVALQFLCLLGLVQVFTNLVGPILQAAGRPGVLSAFAWMAALISAVAFGLGGLAVRGGSVGLQVGGLALARFLGYVLMLGVLAVVLPRLLHLRLGLVAPAVLRPGAASLVGYALGRGVSAALQPLLPRSPFLALILAAIIGALTVGGAFLALEPLARRLVKRAWVRLRGATGTGVEAAAGSTSEATPEGATRTSRQTGDTLPDSGLS